MNKNQEACCLGFCAVIAGFLLYVCVTHAMVCFSPLTPVPTHSVAVVQDADDVVSERPLPLVETAQAQTELATQTATAVRTTVVAVGETQTARIFAAPIEY